MNIILTEKQISLAHTRQAAQHDGAIIIWVYGDVEVIIQDLNTCPHFNLIKNEEDISNSITGFILNQEKI
jgi:hypothetical protein